MIKELISFEDLVKDKYFKIPDYQRGYSWEHNQLVDLLKDIEHTSKGNHKHYSGTVVLAFNNSKRYDIVDGQQRITSLIILLNVIEQSFPGRFPEIQSNFLIRNDEYVLETNLETNTYFKEAIIGARGNYPLEIKSISNLKLAKEHLTEWVLEHQASIDLLYETVVKKLGFSK